ncbi:cheY-like receiver protein [Candidatus Scalindua japonica]|uniref:CheY-like receiver protein n=1 Tax=Candidatus Scalindua japonica TaxID=1284222 RepID=A0A286U232_9BACT|nr:response regulator [Candidatus Scalindua japonica]GAX62213.1 cheY-like receiver protein [Candidatus Scalindua japonica]
MSRKILIVDDEENLRMLLKESLEEFEDKGVELLVAENGSVAIDVINREEPELVILDVMMPGIDGFSVCNTIKNELGLKDVYVLMLSADGQEVNKQRGKDAGSDGFMTKPFDPYDIANKVSEIIGIDL